MGRPHRCGRPSGSAPRPACPPCLLLLALAWLSLACAAPSSGRTSLPELLTAPLRGAEAVQPWTAPGLPAPGAREAGAAGGHRGRALQQELQPGDATLEQSSLAELCPGVNIANSTFVCSATVQLTSGTVRLFRFTLPLSASGNVTIEVTTTPISGDPDVTVDRFASADEADLTIMAAFRRSSEKAAGADAVYVPPSEAAAGDHFGVAVQSATLTSAFVLTVEVLDDARALDATDQQVLGGVLEACCAAGTCFPGLEAAVAGNTTQEPCGISSWHCDKLGHLTHLRLNTVGMQCPVAALAPLTRLPQLRLLDVSGNDISGDLGVLLSAFDAAPKLEALVATGTGLTGALPAACPPGGVLARLKMLLLTEVAVGGALPACLLATAHYIGLRLTRVGGALPALPPSGSPLLYLDLFTAEGAPPAEQFSGPAPDFGAAAGLHQLRMANNAVTGTLSLPASIVTADASNNRLSGVSVAAGAPALQVLRLSGNALVGAVPPFLMAAPQLYELRLGNNQLSEVGTSWDAPRLFLLDLSGNAIAGEVPPQLAELPNLTFLFLERNRFAGPLAAFAAAVPEGSRLSFLDASFNGLTGQINGLERLGVFNASLLIGLSGSLQPLPHLLNVSHNALEGTVPAAMVRASGVQAMGLIIGVDVTNNPLLTCGSVSEAERNASAVFGCTPPSALPVVPPALVGDDVRSESVAMAPGQSGLSSGAIAGIVIGTLAGAALLAGLIAAVVVVVRRRRADTRTLGSFASFDAGGPAVAAVAMPAERQAEMTQMSEV